MCVRSFVHFLYSSLDIDLGTLFVSNWFVDAVCASENSQYAIFIWFHWLAFNFIRLQRMNEINKEIQTDRVHLMSKMPKRGAYCLLSNEPKKEAKIYTNLFSHFGMFNSHKDRCHNQL